jgi:hypothetical protein
MDNNPRRIKRIVNIYSITRALSATALSRPAMVIKWVLLCEQWPVRISWLLQIIEDDQQSYAANRIQLAPIMPLTAVYEAYVEERVFDK